MSRVTIRANGAPSAIGTYSQAVKVGTTVYVSGQIPLDPSTMQLVVGGFRSQARRVLKNVQAVAEAAGGSLSDVVKLNVFLVDLNNFPAVNDVMEEFFKKPYPARAAIGVASLPKDAQIEIDAIIELTEEDLGP